MPWLAPHRWPDLLLTWERPEWLFAALVPAVLIVGASLLRRSGRAPFERTASALRVGVILLCGAALAEPRVEIRSRDRTVVLLRDVSGSIPDLSLRLLESWLASVEPKPGPDSGGERLFGEILAGKQPLPVRWPSPLPIETPSTAGVDRSGTDLDAAIRLALALPRSGGLRILLASDGNPTLGDPLAAADAAAARGVPIDVLPLPAGRTPHVSIDAFRLPARGASGRNLPARVEIRASEPIAGTLRVRRIGSDPPNAEGAGELPLVLEPGSRTISITLPPTTDAIAAFDVRFTADDPDVDRRLDPRTLSARGFVPIDGPSRILIAAGSSGEADALRALVETEDLAIDLIRAEAMPASIEDLARYDLVLLYGASFEEIGSPAAQVLKTGVEDLGIGLIVVGGRDGFAPGWLDTSLAALLPVDLRLPEGRIPRASLALSIDASGSMSESVGPSRRSKREIATDAAAQAVARLEPRDRVAIVSFSGSAHVVSPLAERGDGRALDGRIRSIGVGGGTDIFAGLDAAAREVLSGPPGPHRIVLLSDGNSAGDHAAGLDRVATFARAGLSVSTIAIGDDVNVELMRSVAIRGGGRFHHLRGGRIESALAEILRDEALRIRRPPVMEGGPFQPVPLVGEVPDEVPALTGYGVVTPRGIDAVVALRVGDDPLLAWWNRGLGRVVAFTSDPAAPWMDGWRNWSEHAAFWRRLARWSGRPRGGAVEVTATPAPAHDRDRREGDTLLSIRLPEPERRRLSALDARIWTPEAGATAPALVAQGLGLYRGLFDAGDADAGIIAVSGRYEDGERFLERISFARSRPREWAGFPTNEPLLAAIADRTGGERLDLAAPHVDLFSKRNVTIPSESHSAWPIPIAVAAVLFLIEIAVRRVLAAWGRRQPFRLAVAAVGAKTPPTSSGPGLPPSAESAEVPGLSRLRDAKRRAAERPESRR